MNVRFLLGLLLGFAIGFACRWSGVPAPSPPALVGALIVFMMTVGYVVADRFLASRKATQEMACGGPTGRTERRP